MSGMGATCVPPGVMRQVSYVFPAVDLIPGKTQETQIVPEGVLRVQRVAVAGFMDEIRGHYWIRRSRLPRLDRQFVTAHSTWSRVRARRRTIVEYRGPDRSFTRTYLPSSVEYGHVDPLSYVALVNVFIGDRREPQMPPRNNGCSATFFGMNCLGVGVPMSSGNRVMLLLRNDGDIQVHVHAFVFGVEVLSRGEPLRGTS